jgi:quinolinate synthase
MAMNALQGVLACLEHGSGEITLPEAVRVRALGCIERMLDHVRQHPASLAPTQGGFTRGVGAA